jgi:hypothetical protein
LIFKGFGINPSIEQINDFIRKYRGSAKNKAYVMSQYQFKYDWDPVKVINDKVKNDALMLKMQGRTDK